MKSVLITGGGGFVGSHAVEYYANQENIDIGGGKENTLSLLELIEMINEELSKKKYSLQKMLL